ncbi:MAG TPA: tetratricopeptide repeat protein, partial [Actinomycetota bacterium]
DRRLPLLKSSARDLPERQRTLQGAIAWSYDLLDPTEQRLFTWLGVFIGGWQLAAVEAVAGEDVEIDMLDAMTSLVDKSLIRQATDAGIEPRFWMLETIREFAADRLAESDEREAVARRHAKFFLALAEEAEPHLTAADQQEWLEGLQREMDNMRTAMAWTVEQLHPEMGLRMGAALWRFWQFRGHLEEGAGRMDALLAMPEAAAPTEIRANGLNALASILYWQGEYPRARRLYEEALGIYRDQGNRRGLAAVLYSLGYVAGIERSYEEARSYYEESRALAREIGDRKLEAYNGLGLSLVAQLRGDPKASVAIAREALPLLEELGEAWGMANIMGMIGRASSYLGDPAEARESLRRALQLFRESGDVPGMTWVLDDLATVELAEHQWDRALRIGGAAEASREALGARAPIQLTQYEDPRLKVRGHLADPDIDAAWAAGKAMTIEEAVAYALEEVPAEASG